MCIKVYNTDTCRNTLRANFTLFNLYLKIESINSFLWSNITATWFLQVFVFFYYESGRKKVLGGKPEMVAGGRDPLCLIDSSCSQSVTQSTCHKMLLVVLKRKEQVKSAGLFTCCLMCCSWCTSPLRMFGGSFNKQSYRKASKLAISPCFQSLCEAKSLASY